MESLISLGILLIILIFTGALLGIIAFFKNKKLEKDIWKLKLKVDHLQTLVADKETPVVKKSDIIAALTTKSPLTKQVPVKEEKSGEEKKIVREKEDETPPVLVTKETEKQKIENRVQDIKPEKKSNEFIKNLEKHFQENWTGIIGALITVIGIGFLGVFTALKLSEMYRFIMIVVLCFIFLILYFVLRFHKKWVKLSLWLRSMAAALFLLACAGAGGISGLRWIENPLVALIVLCFGIGANILLAILGKKQVVASIHLLLSLAALAIAPQNQVIFIIATIVTLAGIMLTFREKWEYHLLLSTTLYCVYLLFYYYISHPLTMPMKMTGIAGISMVSILSIFVHYSKIYTNPSFDIKPFLTHLLTWIYFGIGVYIYSPRVTWISLPLGAGAILCFILAHRARILKIRWLFNTDILMSQVIAVITVFTLLERDISHSLIACILVIETLVFSSIVLLEGEDFLYHCGQWFFYFFSLLLIILSFINSLGQDTSLLFPDSILVSTCIIVIMLYHIFTNHTLEKKFIDTTLKESSRQLFKAHKIVCGVIAGFLFIPLYFSLLRQLPWAKYIDIEYLFLAPLCVIIIISEKIRSDGLGISILFTLFIMHIFMWQSPVLTGSSFWYEKLIYSFPLFVLDLVCIRFAFIKSLHKYIKWPGIYLFSTHLFVVTYFVFNPLSPLVPGVTWLFLSVVMLELSRLIRKGLGDKVVKQGSPDIHFLYTGYVYIGAFLIRHILVHLPSGQYIGIFKIRLLIEIFAFLVFLYWALSKKPGGNKISKSYLFLHPLFPELITIFTILTITVEIKNIYHPVAWILLSIVALFLGMKIKQGLSRFRFHSLVLYWISIIHLTFLISPLVMPSFRFLSRTWVWAVIAVFLQIAYIVFFYKKGDISTIELPGPLFRLERFIALVEKRKNLRINYPLFIFIALFLVRSFDASILTLLLSAECFLIFVISIILKENHFRYLSLAGLGGCMIRLAFYDLAVSNILTKAIICIGVGLLLIGMNTLYNKFSSRYK